MINIPNGDIRPMKKAIDKCIDNNNQTIIFLSNFWFIISRINIKVLKIKFLILQKSI